MHLPKFTDPLRRIRAFCIPGEFAYSLLKTFVGAVLFVSASGVLFGEDSRAQALSLAVASAQSGAPQYNSQTVPVLKPAFNINPNAGRGGGDIAVVGGSALLAQAGPSGTIADIEERPSSSQISVYVVHEGDTLGGIAKMFGVSTNTIVWANDLKGGAIRPGQELVILPITGLKHTVLKGETLSSLAKKYQSDAGEIAQYNGLPDNAALAVGDMVIIPNGVMALTPEPASQPKKKFTGSGALPVSGGPAIPGYFVWPVAGGVITQGLHGWNGVDIGAPTGTSVYASAAGTVIVARSGSWNGGYGNYVVVAHGNGTQTLYAHLSRVLASPGDSVGEGEIVGKVGSTGQSTGPHLHFEVRGAANPFAR